MKSALAGSLARGVATSIGVVLLPLACGGPASGNPAAAGDAASGADASGSSGSSSGSSTTGSSGGAIEAGADGGTTADAAVQDASGSCPVTITIPSKGEAVGSSIQISVEQSCAGWTTTMSAAIDGVDCSASGYPSPNAGCDTTGGAQNFATSTWVRVTPGPHTLVVTNTGPAGAVSVSAPVSFSYTAAGADGGEGGATSVDPVLVGAGDIAYGGGGAVATGKELQALVAANPGAMVFTLGDDAYGNSTCDEGGSTTDYTKNYVSTGWNALLARTLPMPGNHEFNNCDLSNTVGPCIPSKGCGTIDGSSWVMNGYWAFFNGHSAVTPGGGTATSLHYGYDFTTSGGKKWRYVSLNSGMCFYTDNCSKGSSEYSWFANELATHSKGTYDGGAYAGIIVGTHIDRWDSAGCPGGSGYLADMFDLAYSYKVDLWMDGHVHGYERFGPIGKGCESGQTASGCSTFCGPAADPAGPVLIDLGSGGADDWSGIDSHPLAQSVHRIPNTYAVGRIRMHDASWDFTLYDTNDDVIDGMVTYPVH
ncbi:MAG TPA: metallophosphoesterase [Polyangiaceae bacterium]